MRQALIGGTLIDGTGGPPVEDALVLVEDDTIKYAGAAKGYAIPEDAARLATAGKVIMPGMIDAHIHICEAWVPLDESIPVAAIKGVANAKIMLDAGFTTCRDMGATGYCDVALKHAIDNGSVLGPRLAVSGEPLVAVGSRFGGWYRPDVSFAGGRSSAFSGVDSARAAVRKQIYNGADSIKLIAHGGAATHAPTFPGQKDQELTLEEIRAICDEAHRRGKRVAAHAFGPNLNDLLIGGVDSIEHGGGIDDEGIALMVEKGTHLVPTLTIYHNYPNIELFPHWRRCRGAFVRDAAFATFPKYLAKQLKIAAGSDGINVAVRVGTSAKELELLVTAGMTPMQAIVAATKTAAEVIGWQDRLGTVQEGKLADILVIHGNPLDDIKILQRRENIILIMKGGKLHKSQLS